MKNIVLLLFISILGLSVKAQDDKMVEAMKEPINIEVNETSIKYQKETIKVQTVYVHGDPKKLEKKWKDYFEEKYACEFEKEKGAYIARNIKMTDITNESVSLMGMISPDEDGAKLDMGVDLGFGYINEKANSVEAGNLQRVMRNFVSEFYVGWYDDVIASERKDFEKSEKEHEKMVKEGEKLAKNLESTNGRITKAEENIVKSEEEISELQLKIEQLKADIEKYKNEVTGLEKEIETNKTEVEKQKTVVESKRTELEKLKSNADRLKIEK